MFNPYSRHFYVRIWLAVAGGVVVLTLTASWLMRIAVENERERVANVPRSVVVLDDNDREIGSGSALRVPGKGIEFDVTLDDGRKLSLQMARREDIPGPDGRRTPPPWWRTPYGPGWLIVLVGMAVALGVYPIVRRMTKRLEVLQRSVQRWGEGDLSARVPQDGEDEVADLAERFNESAARIETLVRSHKSLLANASHELRSPLTRIRMAVELMGQHPSELTRTEITRNIAELDQLIDEILLASRLDAREADMGTVESVELVGLAAEECARTNAELELSEGTDASALTVRGVPRLLRRAIRNLLENARRYGGNDISLELQTEGPQAKVVVNDRGPGVPPALRDRIFEPFYRLPGASEREGGVGLGLALVKSIAERHGGSVRCESRPGGGASFVITLPR
ncbi:HAMP domain-containing sensor histidine kinase [Variovorax sp. OV329]|uniref:sensor histidine kinase n=1 Tax=Variovorax sp. OV329 TaxID=1882825 RepID=UPI0008DF6411|nr:ATP-binding protein [Variovorax sp. OV329]SFN31200.1 Signal transduction histidine kinase [Variovorax sp. OV329]